MKVYHSTNAAGAILAEGFKETRQNKALPNGIWLSDVPLDVDEVNADTNGTVDCNVLSFNEKGLVACGIVLRESMN